VGAGGAASEADAKRSRRGAGSSSGPLTKGPPVTSRRGIDGGETELGDWEGWSGTQARPRKPSWATASWAPGGPAAGRRTTPWPPKAVRVHESPRASFARGKTPPARAPLARPRPREDESPLALARCSLVTAPGRSSRPRDRGTTRRPPPRL